MILLADSGSTKTDWVLLKEETKIQQCYTQGISPSFQTTEQITTILRGELSKEILAITPETSLTIFFYGTGCSTAQKKEVVKHALQDLFPKAQTHIDHDLMASALALCGNKPGIACILGTGSNSCYFDGKEIKENLLSVGYLFGDYGSGAHIGKTLLQDYFDERIPADLLSSFRENERFAPELILENIYKKPMPQRFLASYTKVIKENMQHPYCKQVVKKCFTDFLRHQVLKYSVHASLPVSFVGSVAFHFKEELAEALEENKLSSGSILQSPMEGLVKYHSADESRI